MRIFVTGVNGQLAHSLADVLAAQGDSTATFLGRPTFDLTEYNSAEKIAVSAQPDVIINAAAYTAVDKAEAEPELAFAINANGAAAMARAARTLDIPLIQISTDYVFSGAKTSAYIEADDTEPLGVYGHSKLAGEEAVRSITDRHYILRTSWIYSAYGANFVRTMIRLGQERKNVNVVDDQFGCPTFAEDLASAIVTVCRKIKNEQGNYGTYHAAGQGVTSWADFAREIFALQSQTHQSVPTVTSIPTSQYPTAAKRPTNSVLDCQKLYDVFGLLLPNWQDSLKKCLTTLQQPPV